MLLRLVKVIVSGSPQRGTSSTVLSRWTRTALRSALATSRRASRLRVGQDSAKAVTVVAVGACFFGLVELREPAPGLVDLLLDGLAAAFELGQVPARHSVGVGI